MAGKKVYVAGHAGMVGSALSRRLAGESCAVVTATRAEVDLRDQAAVLDWMRRVRPNCVIVAAATVGGILANSTRPAEFLYDNLAIAGNLIEAARIAEVEKLLYLGSTCVYPRLAPQPIAEESLLTGPLEPTNEWYAIAKIAGLKLCAAYRRQYGCDFIAAQPTNLYGPGDNFNLASAHVIPALMARIHAAKLADAPAVELWGTGTPLREFLHVDDLADALVFLLRRYSDEMHINIGSGEEISIGDLAATLTAVIGFGGALRYDRSKPDGTPRKLVDSSRLRSMGWRASTSLRDGLASTYAWYLRHVGGDVRT
ncbi:MAG: GDP-L-fucose synthase [Alphaproteobacteria bacterium]|nr:GDP-L-fucose synthase [Alphaproteobacteria bacterium]